MEKKEFQKQREKELLKLRTILGQTFNNDNGIRTLKLIKELSGYDKTNIVKNLDGTISTDAMLYNEGRRDIYLELRKFLSNNILTKVEILQEGDESTTKK